MAKVVLIINPSLNSTNADIGLNTRTLHILEVTTKTLSVRTNNVYAPSFEAMESFFTKLDKGAVNGVNGVPGVSADTTSFAIKAHALLFDTHYSTLNEAIRMLRAKAILAFAGIPLEEVVKSVLEKADRLENDIAEERATAVKIILEQAKSKVRG
jgi:hypothetical protein